WEVPDGREDHVAAVTSPDGPAAGAGEPVTDPDLPVAEANADPLARQDETRPGFTDGPYLASTDPASPDPASTDPEMYETSPAGRDAFPGDAVSEHPVTGTTVAGDTGAGDTGAGDRVGAAGAQAPEERRAAAPEGLHPGESAGTLDDLGDLAYGKLIPDAADFTAQWQQIQFRFVDDPQASVTEAAEVVAQVTAKLEAAIQERQRAIQARQQAIQERQRSLAGRWGEGTQADTETLRETLRMYRAFLDQLIGPKA
ncbi:MAG: hypothetical protein M3Z75_28160, partial [Actinomycetota bacterium]|nr:hypothetical protein [Actinomycetota bacterium]